MFHDVAKTFDAYNTNLTFGHVDCSKSPQICERLNVELFPHYLLFDRPNMDPVEHYDDLSSNALVQFLIQRYNIFVRKQPNFVNHLSYSNFTEYVMNPDQNVFVAFTANWCGYCAPLPDVFKQVSLSFREEDHIQFGLVDGGSNRSFADIYGVGGFPTIILFPAMNSIDDIYKQDSNRRLKIASMSPQEFSIWNKNKDQEQNELRKQMQQKDRERSYEEDKNRPKWQNREQRVTHKGGKDIIRYRFHRDYQTIVRWINARIGTLRKPLETQVDAYERDQAIFIRHNKQYNDSVTLDFKEQQNKLSEIKNQALQEIEWIDEDKTIKSFRRNILKYRQFILDEDNNRTEEKESSKNIIEEERLIDDEQEESDFSSESENEHKDDGDANTTNTTHNMKTRSQVFRHLSKRTVQMQHPYLANTFKTYLSNIEDAVKNVDHKNKHNSQKDQLEETETQAMNRVINNEINRVLSLIAESNHGAMNDLQRARLLVKLFALELLTGQDNISSK
ncbi:MAG: hypothetical protein EZS28_005365 [Streblomastix strix]|uniref:Thioredoxin domain-containing protein n=1 Tax=Streblomastix strix TaxID=222440 RepID=A0A5J4WVZ0_9EUKA|nr:MAG: hypothetical protein EZS28_005365 [Streblomastix strix]